MGGNDLLVSMWDLAADQGLTIDHARFPGHPASPWNVGGTAACQDMVKGTDWMAPARGSATGDDFPGGTTWTEVTPAMLGKPRTRRHKPLCAARRGDPALDGRHVVALDIAEYGAPN
jgi:hypothetical protein